MQARRRQLPDWPGQLPLLWTAEDDNGMDLLDNSAFIQRVTLGCLLAAAAVSRWRQAHAERARTRVAAAD